MKRSILLTGFGPFPGVPVNASGQLVGRLARAVRGAFPAADVHAAVLPTQWRRGTLRAASLIKRFEPDVAIHFGVSSKAQGFVIERRGVNVCVASEDGAGLMPETDVLDPKGPHVRRASLPVSAIVSRLRGMGLPAIASDDAGHYLCNAVLYQSLGLAAAREGAIAGFVHLPASLAMETQAGGGEEKNVPLTIEQALAGSLAVIAVCLA